MSNPPIEKHQNDRSMFDVLKCSNKKSRYIDPGVDDQIINLRVRKKQLTRLAASFG